MKTPTHDRLSGEVEADETYVGGSARKVQRNVGTRASIGRRNHPGPKGSNRGPRDDRT